MDCLLAIECQSPKLHCSWFLLVYTIHRAELTALRFALPPLGFHMKGLLTRRTFDLEAHQLPLSLSTQYCSSSGVPTSSLHDQVTDAIAILHWYGAIVPSYLDQLVPVSSLTGCRRLRSSFTLQLLVPSYRLSTVGRRSFPVAASMFWNTLPDDI